MIIVSELEVIHVLMTRQLDIRTRALGHRADNEIASQSREPELFFGRVHFVVAWSRACVILSSWLIVNCR
jgi:hypothetical protein